MYATETPEEIPNEVPDMAEPCACIDGMASANGKTNQCPACVSARIVSQAPDAPIQ